MSAPKAYLIDDFSGSVRKHFTIAHGYQELSTMLSESANLTAAERYLQTLAPQMNFDPIGSEDYFTAHETSASGDKFASFHYMVLGANGEQRFHYHPPAKGNLESSVRHVLLYPLWNQKTGQDGITFEWFNISDRKINLDAPSEYPIIEGNPQGEKHVVQIPAGHIALITFGAGVHAFKGDALAISAHFLDIDTGNIHGSFLGNTAGYVGNIPEQTKLVQLEKPKLILPKRSSDLQRNFTVHANIIRHYVDTYGGHALPESMNERFVEHLRNGELNLAA